MFQSNKAVVLNHDSHNRPHPNHEPPGWLHVTLDTRGRNGDGESIFSERRVQDGWTVQQEWIVQYRGYLTGRHTVQPGVQEKNSRNGSNVIQVTRSTKGWDFEETFSVTDRGKLHVKNIERASFANWDQKGRLIFARDGKIWTGRLSKSGLWSEKEIADFNSSKPQTMPPPFKATHW